MPADSEERALTDFETAEAIRDKSLPSPQQYGDFHLFDLRITGTGVAYRDAIDEYAIRDPEKWLADEFVQRCNGLPVIFEHPDGSGLNHDEYQERAIGTIVLPYVKGDEVWGIAKIFDADAAQLMQTTHRSTSPGVMPTKDAKTIELDDGRRVLDEDLPLVLDHLAVCAAGVWDKNGPPEGIRLDSTPPTQGETVDKEEREKLEQDREDARARADAAEKERDDYKTKLDEFEQASKAKDDASKKDVDPDPADPADKKDTKKDDDEKPADEKNDGAPVDPVDANQLKELTDASRKDSARIAQLESTIASLSKQPTIDDRNEIAKAYHRADSAYQMLGEQAPHALHGETPRAYRSRLAAGLGKHAKSRYALHDALDAHSFDLVETAIYNDASEAAKAQIHDDNVGVLREVKSTENGKSVSRFYGDAKAAFAPFMPSTRTFIKFTPLAGKR